jgi:hypothetical protein
MAVFVAMLMIVSLHNLVTNPLDLSLILFCNRSPHPCPDVIGFPVGMQHLDCFRLRIAPIGFCRN